MVGDLLSRRRRLATLASVATVVAMMGAVMPAAAQTTEAPSRVEATPKGTIGLGLIGAELGLVIPAVSGLKKTWSLILFPTLGAGAGAVAGYFAIDEPGREKGAVTTLVIGIGLAIPAAIWTLVATAYDPRDEVRRQPKRGPTLADTGLLRLHTTKAEGEGRAKVEAELGMPAVAMLAAYTDQEVQQYGARQVARLHVPVISGRF